MNESVLKLVSDLVRHFGVGVCLSFVFAYAVARVYDDLGLQNQQLVRLIERQSESETRLAVALELLIENIEK